MRVIEGLDALAALSLPDDPDRLESGSVVCVGVFDGVHLGHQRLLHELVELASELKGVPTVITFANHPDAVLRGEAPPAIVSVPHRLRLLRRAGVERAVVLEFNERLRATGAEAFARDLLARDLHARGMLLGYDSAMGKDRSGTPSRFRELGRELGFEVREAQPFFVDGEPVSSTRIRAAVTGGELEAAHRLLGRWPSVLGTVEEGEGRGRTLGFPTANVAMQPSVQPPPGVYAAQVIRDGETFGAVANLGVRPTFGADGAPVLEVHLLDFDGDLYGATLEVCFLAHLRGEQKFADAEALKAQIAHDADRARAALG